MLCWTQRCVIVFGHRDREVGVCAAGSPDQPRLAAHAHVRRIAQDPLTRLRAWAGWLRYVCRPATALR